MTLLNDISRHQDTRPIKPENRVVEITRLDNGGMTCRRASGETFTIEADDAAMQAFVVFTMLHGHEF